MEEIYKLLLHPERSEKIWENWKPKTILLLQRSEVTEQMFAPDLRHREANMEEESLLGLSRRNQWEKPELNRLCSRWRTPAGAAATKTPLPPRGVKRFWALSHREPSDFCGLYPPEFCEDSTVNIKDKPFCFQQEDGKRNRFEVR